MTFFWFDRYQPCLSAEGGGLAAAAAAAGGGDGSGEEQSGGNANAGAWSPPEGLPAEYAGTTADETLSKLLPAFTEAQTRMTGLRTKLGEMPKAPDTADGYSFEPDDKLKPWFSDLDKDPAYKHAREAAKAAGLSQDQFSKFIGGVYGPMIDGGLLAQPYSPAREIEAFSSASGLQGKDAQQALVEADAFAKGLVGQLKGVPAAAKTDVEALLVSLTDTAAGNHLLRGLAARLSENGIRIGGSSVNQGELTAEDVKALHSDPRIDPRNRSHPDPDKRYDEDLRRRYDEATNKPR